jgi:hypothetical protein
MERQGFVEYSFLAESILIGIYGNSSLGQGQVRPEMARRLPNERGLVGEYDCFWMDENNGLVPAKLHVREVVGRAGFEMIWMENDAITFRAEVALVTPDRLVGYYIMLP